MFFSLANRALSRSCTPRFNRGCARVDLKDLAGAQSDFNEAIDLWPRLAASAGWVWLAWGSSMMAVELDHVRLYFLALMDPV